MFERSEFADFSNVLIFQVFCNTGLAFLVTFGAMPKVTRALALLNVLANGDSKDCFGISYTSLQNIYSKNRTYILHADRHKNILTSSWSSYDSLFPSF